MKKVLFCATVDFHFTSFHLPTFKWFKQQGWEIHVAAAGSLTIPYVDQRYEIPIQRSPFHIGNLEAYSKLKKIIDHNKYDVIHCHTPVGGVLTRLAARETRKNGTKVIYTAHGFHFCKGAPLLNWMLYYPLEKILSSYTDCLVTINHEDYYLAKNHRFSVREVAHIHGVGVDAQRFKPVSERERAYLRFRSGYRQTDFLLFYAAEFNKNKNQQLLIRVMAEVVKKVPHAKLLLAGDGPLLQKCRELAQQLGITDHIAFLGYRTDIDEILPMCDVAVASSLREGLPVNILEAMAVGLPVIATANRGHNELIRNHVTGCLIENQNMKQAAYQIEHLAVSVEKRKQMGKAARELIMAHYDIRRIMEQNSNLYRSYMGDHTLETFAEIEAAVTLVTK